MRVRIALVLPSLAVAAAIAGCGGGGGGGSSSTTTAGNGVASQPPAQIVASAAAALGTVQSFHIAGTGTDSGGQTSLSGDVALPGKLHLTLQQGATSVQIIVVDGAAYLNANAAFYEKSGAPARLANALGGRWIKAPQSQLAQFGTFVAFSDPKTIGHCMLQSHLGSLTSGGTSSVSGQPAVVVVDTGDLPGSKPGRGYFATTGKPLPLRLEETGPRKPGGVPDPVCRETRSDLTSSGTSDLTISDYDKPVTISAPAGATSLQALLRQQGGL